jgi:hypothetical protein
LGYNRNHQGRGQGDSLETVVLLIDETLRRDKESGGFYPENPMDEIWRFDATAQQWERVLVTGDPFLRVKDQGQASVVNGSIYLVGGYSCVPGISGNGERAYINDVHKLTVRCAKTENPLPKNSMSVSSEL